MKVAGLLALSTLISIAQLTPLLAQSTSNQADFEISKPFEGPVTKENFGKCFKTDEKQLEAFSRILYWGYTFEPHLGCPPNHPQCDETITWQKIRRTIRVDAGEANPSHVFATIASQSRESCTSPREFGSFSAQITPQRAQYNFHSRVRARACPPWGGSMTIAEGNADVSAGYILNPDFSLTSFQEVTNEEGKFLGYFKGGLAESMVALAFGGTLVVLPLIGLEIARHDLIAKLRSRDFLGAGINVAKYLQGGVLRDVDNVGTLGLDLVTQQQESGFRLVGDQVTLEVVQDDYFAAYDETNVRDIRRLEIEFLKSLPEVAPEMYVVRKGDNLWNISKKRFGDPRLFLFLKDYAGLKRTRLKIGEQLKIPRWWEICQKLKPNKLFVRDDESLWKKAMAGEIPSPSELDRVRTRSGSKNLIYPYEELRVIERPPGDRVTK